MTAARSGSDLEIIREDVLLEIPRGDDVLRVTRAFARTGEGKDVSWLSLREFYRSEKDNAWLPGKRGITIRTRELAAVAAALGKAAAESSVCASQAPESRALPAEREELPDETYRRLRGRPGP